MRSPEPALFFARVVFQDLGAVALYEIEAAFAQLDVSRDDTIDAALDLVFVEHGRLTIESEFGALRVDAGMIAAAPTWIAHHLEVAEHTAGLVVRLDRTAVDTVLPQPIQRPLVLEQQTALRRAVRAFAREVLLIDDDVSAIESYGTQQLLVEMAGVLLLDTFGVGLSKGTPTAALRDRAIAYIAQTRANNDLTARDIARGVQVSLRRLQAAFAETGSSVSSELRRQRAQLAHDLLVDSRYDVLSIDDIAMQSGFGTSVSLRRALRTTFGVGPSRLRAGRGE